MRFDKRSARSKSCLYLLLACGLAGSVGRMEAQESVRPSLTGASAAEARRPSFRATQNYNAKLGPVLFDLRGGLEVEFNDNVNLSEHNRESDIILRPELSVNAFWQATPLNALRLELGLAYGKYLLGNGEDTRSILINPSQISFDIFVGDFRINIHDQFSIQQNAVEEIQISNTSDYTRFQNSAGISVLWDLNDLKLTFGYDHYNFRSISGDFTFLDRDEEQFYLTAAFFIRDGLTTGLDVASAVIDFEENYNNDAVSFQVGPFLEMQLSDYLKFRVAGGYQSINFDSGGANLDRSDVSGPYTNITLAHRLNTYLSHSITAGYEARLGLTSNSVNSTYVRYNADWRMNQAVTVNFLSFFETAEESDAVFAEDSTRFGAGVGFNYQLTQKLDVGARYEFTVKNSSLPERDYYQNRVTLQLDYDF